MLVELVLAALDGAKHCTKVLNLLPLREVGQRREFHPGRTESPVLDITQKIDPFRRIALFGRGESLAQISGRSVVNENERCAVRHERADAGRPNADKMVSAHAPFPRGAWPAPWRDAGAENHGRWTVQIARLPCCWIPARGHGIHPDRSRAAFSNLRPASRGRDRERKPADRDGTANRIPDKEHAQRG